MVEVTRDEQITRILDQLKGGVGTFLQGEGEKLASYVQFLEETTRRQAEAWGGEVAYLRRQIDHLTQARDTLANQSEDLRRQLAERDAEMKKLKSDFKVMFIAALLRVAS